MARRPWWSVVVLAATVALAGCGGSPSAPQRTATQSVVAAGAQSSWVRTRTTFADGVFTACDGELFTVTTVVDVQVHRTTRPSGEWVLTHHTRVSVEGVGAVSGARYVGRGTIHDTQVFAPPHESAFTFTSVSRMRNIVQGSADNDVVDAHVKWTLSARGELTVDRADVKSECRG
jgi:hypothetical protein